MRVLSPLTNKPAIKLKTLNVAEIINKYLMVFKLDVVEYFNKYKTIDVFECPYTKYQFYFPDDVIGDSRFYEHLQQYDWYYMPWKWEHKIAINYIRKGFSILEVGCAQGDFLKQVQKLKKAEVTGLELNESVRNKDFNILNETIQVHAEKNKNKYHVVCSFQVLEHVADVSCFLRSKVATLKEGGYLIISVPNNKSFIKYSFKDNILNMPPHHLGLWNKYSLKKISKLFGLKLIRIKHEPLQSYHFEWYLNNIEKRIKGWKFFYLIYSRFKIKGVMWCYVRLFKTFIKGHSVIAIYKKL